MKKLKRYWPILFLSAIVFINTVACVDDDNGDTNTVIRIPCDGKCPDNPQLEPAKQK